MKAFLHGRYSLDGDNLQRVFEIHAHAHGKEANDLTLDLQEFKSICFQANEEVKAFDKGEQAFDQMVQQKTQTVVCWACLCCLPTVGCSCCLFPNCFLSSLQKEQAERAFSYNDRLNKKLAESLVKPAK